MDQERQNLQSTQHKPGIPPIKQQPDPDPHKRTDIFISAVTPATDKIYTDLTGKFPIQSSLGNKYILIVYHYDANAIIAEPLRDRTAGEIAKAHERVYNYLTLRGLKPKFEILDNECSAELIRMMKKHDIQYQLVPPIYTGPTQRREQSAHGRTTSFQSCAVSIQHFHYNYGTGY